jgi:hypothetical protein
MFKVLGIVLRWYPVIVGIVTSLEAFSNPGTTGEQKRRAALAAVSKFLSTAGVKLTPAQLEMVGKVIDGIVSVFNFLGTFRSDADTPPAEKAMVAAAAGVIPSARDIEQAVAEAAATDPALAGLAKATAAAVSARDALKK